ncbi:hypothetical protein [Subtercola sp. RTI3]|uniref:hypothetical protein n=1 Tax=Subtercola sp. RTI3 TaxID=3048639 RepID=UPI002B23C332|nr:hypothetical protein [Subtercola sp. RTI3]MEA9987222.1 hypothetical protein [Subtercola sp. RTI3]
MSDPRARRTRVHVLYHAEQSGVAVATSDQIMVSNIRRLILEQIERQDLAPATIATDLGTVARRFGFRSVDASGRAFRERFGCTMTEFRLRRVLPAPLE